MLPPAPKFKIKQNKKLLASGKYYLWRIHKGWSLQCSGLFLALPSGVSQGDALGTTCSASDQTRTGCMKGNVINPVLPLWPQRDHIQIFKYIKKYQTQQQWTIQLKVNRNPEYTCAQSGPCSQTHEKYKPSLIIGKMKIKSIRDTDSQRGNREKVLSLPEGYPQLNPPSCPWRIGEDVDKEDPWIQSRWRELGVALRSAAGRFLTYYKQRDRDRLPQHSQQRFDPWHHICPPHSPPGVMPKHRVECKF